MLICLMACSNRMEHCRASASAKVITKSCGNFHEGFGATSAQTSQQDDRGN
jgi:hypothetical protein